MVDVVRIFRPAFDRRLLSDIRRWCLVVATAAVLCAGSANAAERAPQGDSASGSGTAVARARALLDTLGYEDVMRGMIVSINGQTLPGEPHAPGDKALLQRWLAAAQLRPIAAATAERLAVAADSEEIDVALRYFRSDAGRTEIACLRESAGAPVLESCIRDKGGAVQLQAYQDFRATGIDNTLGDVLGESLGPDLFAAIAVATARDPALEREIAAYCRRRPSGLCAMSGHEASTDKGAP
ncbi:hypothetical protein [Lysobacter sp. CA199]|uniref:hypothetical protein n=1 Tax=Lysobacter sp. CA199 TaxID=3455608 RepID=UPI003F8D5076